MIDYRIKRSVLIFLCLTSCKPASFLANALGLTSSILGHFIAKFLTLGVDVET